ncbi:MAG: SseB family protein [Eubacteriales bacterium]|jgi:hypothetical protein
MAIDNSFMIKKLEHFDSIYVLYSAYTHCPFIECDEETADDQVYCFTTKEMTNTFAHPYQLEKILLQAVQVPQKMMKSFFQNLYLYGVNAIMIQDEGAPVRVQLSQIAEKPDLEAMKNDKIPRANPELQLTGLYFMQDLMRPVERTQEEKRHLHDLEADMAHYLLNSRFIVTADVTKINGKITKENIHSAGVPLVKTKSGHVYQPIYTDFVELQKFNHKNKGMKLEMITVTYDKLKDFITPQSEGFVFNPAGFNLVLNRDQLDAMQRRYAEEV